MTETAMCWGIDTNDGWYDLIDMLCDQLQFNTDNNKYPQVEATQVKEKFGTLRFYYTTLNVTDKLNQDHERGHIDGLISFAEFLSGYICEKCGTNQNVTTNEDGWISTLCDKCRTKKQGE